MTIYQGQFNAADKRIGIVVAQFNDIVTKRLLEGAQASLKQLGVQAVDVVWVPGAFELPRAARQLAASGQVDGIVTLGAVIRGETNHYDYVCQETAHGIATLAMQAPVPVMFGVLTCDTLEQAINRAGGKAGNKGSECASGVLAMIDLQAQLSAQG